jgi:hypothetical protein
MYIWCIYGVYMVYIWCVWCIYGVYGVYMVYIWCIYGNLAGKSPSIRLYTVYLYTVLANPNHIRTSISLAARACWMLGYKMSEMRVCTFAVPSHIRGLQHNARDVYSLCCLFNFLYFAGHCVFGVGGSAWPCWRATTHCVNRTSLFI